MTGGGSSHTADAYRGFLFADLRGYTADVERHGDEAAAALLDAYRALVRSQVARHDGAEIKTEGDSFYVVFSSARRAVRCALDIQAAARDHNAASPPIPIRVGIGVHAGEVVEGSEGYVGAAVNAAARICALAGPGEVLVSRTVRDLTRTGLMLATHPRGAHRLKGIAEPLELFSVRDESAGPGAPHRRPVIGAPRSRVTGAVMLATVAALAATIVLGDRFLGALPASAPSTSPGADASPIVGSGAAHASTSPSATPDPGVFPNTDEAALLARLRPSIADACRRADPADAPRVTQVRGAEELIPLPVVTGLHCELVLTDQPDIVEFWHAADHVRTVDDAFFRFTGVGGLPPGDCAVEDRAYGRWAFGEWTGRVACTVSSDDARIMWTYDDERIMGIAVRNDADGRALYRWWRENARLLGPG